MRSPAQSLRLTVVGGLVGLLTATALLTTAGAHAATSYDTTSYSARLLALVNTARDQHGLRPLVFATGTTMVAWDWTQHLADKQALSHNQRLGRQLATHGSSRWRVYGENVGVGSADDPDGLFEAYMHSPEHRANILNADYRYVGVAVVFTDSRSWNTFDFVDVYGNAQPARHSGRRHVQAATDAVPAAARPVRERVVAARSTPAPHVVVRVKGLQHRAQPVRVVHRRPVVGHRFVGIAAGPSLTAVPGPLVADFARMPVDRTHSVALALAVLVLMFVARRWMLTAVRRNA